MPTTLSDDLEYYLGGEKLLGLSILVDGPPDERMHKQELRGPERAEVFRTLPIQTIESALNDGGTMEYAHPRFLPYEASSPRRLTVTAWTASRVIRGEARGQYWQWTYLPRDFHASVGMDEYLSGEKSIADAGDKWRQWALRWIKEDAKITNLHHETEAGED